jgi:carbamoyltransferase
MNKKDTIIVGYQSGRHDVAYCILKNGVPVIHEELERLLRVKEPGGDGLEMFFQRNGTDVQVDHFSFANLNEQGQIRNTSEDSLSQMNKTLKKSGGSNHILGHHKSHAANAFFSSNFQDALIFTIDGGGIEEDGFISALTIWQGDDTKIEPLTQVPITTLNLGAPWRLYTEKIFGLSSGYPKGNQVGTVMALACVGDPEKYYLDFYNAFTGGGGGHNARVKANCDKYRPIAERSEQDKYDVAAALQKATEDIVKGILSEYIDQYQPNNICLSGGVALNCLMTGKMIDWFPNINFFVDPVPYDAGLCLGSARYVWHQVLGNPRIEWKDNSSSYLGAEYDEQDVLDSIKELKCSYEKVTDENVLDLIIDQKIVSVFGGGSKSGRRALGNRSILADPRYKEMKDTINAKVKHRQWFRPFAPSIIREEVKNWFEHDIDSPYMSFAIKFKEEVRDKAQAVVHFDGSGRLQTVTENDNKWYYNFIKAFGQKTGVPILLNTSFNDREPIVETPADAIKCFMGTDIDYLYFHEYGILIKK